MKDKKTTTFLESCISCDRPMRDSNGKLQGGFMSTVSVDGETIFSTECWYCVFDKEPNEQ